VERGEKRGPNTLDTEKKRRSWGFAAFLYQELVPRRGERERDNRFGDKKEGGLT